MKVSINDGESYWIVFNYPRDLKEVLKWDSVTLQKHPIGETFCFIYDDSTHGEPKIVATGIALCSSKDRFIKESGRQISLSRALDRLFPKDDTRRSLFLDVYFNRKNYSKNLDIMN